MIDFFDAMKEGIASTSNDIPNFFDKFQDGYKKLDVSDSKEIPRFFDNLKEDNTSFIEEKGMLPTENGTWDGEKGNSVWKPDINHKPESKSDSDYNNPDKQTMGEILLEEGIDGITFKDGEPDFSEVSKGTVEIGDFTDSRPSNFAQADIELAKQRGCTPEEIKEWRKENGYTWHECNDMKTMQLVPHKIHANVPHSGGISEYKKTMEIK